MAETVLDLLNMYGNPHGLPEFVDSRHLDELRDTLSVMLDDDDYLDEHEDFHKAIEDIDSLAAEFGSEFADGITLVSDGYFEAYAQEFASDIGAVSGNERWPANHIDWKAAAAELRQDYIEVQIGGEKFWGRS